MTDDRLRLGLLWLAALTGVAMSAWVVGATLAQGGLRPDFTVFWTAARFWAERPADLYDIEAITRAQDAIVGAEAARPWVYPPSALPWIAALALMPVWPAMATWSAVTAALFGWAGFAMTRDWRAVALAFLAPAMGMQLIAGQTSLMLGGMVLGACALLKSRPILAGVLFGLAATIKPQAVILVPLALVVARQWPSLGAAVVAGLVVGGLSYAADPQLWWDWLEAMRVFPAIVEAIDLPKRSLGASGLAAALGVEGAAALALTAAGYALGVALTALVWWRAQDVRLRAVALIAGSLLVSPYAMGYDATPLALLGFAMLGDRALNPRLWAAGMLLTMTGNALVLVAAAASLLAALAARPVTEPAHQGYDA